MRNSSVWPRFPPKTNFFVNLFVIFAFSVSLAIKIPSLLAAALQGGKSPASALPATIVTLTMVIAGAFIYEMFVSRPDWLLPRSRPPGASDSPSGGN